ncbi:hypothetical protein E2P86_08620 [Sphingobacterium psychroaquaticum]|uniref:hypothetical protein n=1 Tax=Sphingobacterium psychroaquaticum TaxID=561061 RepID=UPI00106AC7A0|nr:hypothetical protein [Sphingobacterium psychroaquaticum]QBQ41216.1 hypothetical protein E2P86_08620 [Sphingobacterium psychroaquaticum]
MSAYRINGIDPEITYGLTIEKGFNASVRAMPELKDNGLSIDWADDNGVDRYHGIRKFASKSYQVQCVIIATSAADLLTKYNALETFLLTTGLFNLDDLNAGRRYKVFYNKMTSLTTSITWARFTLELIDDFPTDKFPIV